MHEVGIMESALAAVLAQAHSHHAHQVHRIWLRVGALSGVEPDALRFAFAAIGRDGPTRDAVLEIEIVPAQARCASCGIDFPAEAGQIFSCPRCHHLSGDLRQGRELELTRIEMS